MWPSPYPKEALETPKAHAAHELMAVQKQNFGVPSKKACFS